jgi:phosphatidate cytidylyltransferase
MKLRVIAAAALLPLLLLVVLVLPKVCTAILFGIMAVIAAYELMWRTGLAKHPRLLLYACAMGFSLNLWCVYGIDTWTSVALFAFIVLVFSELLFAQTKLPFEMIAITFISGVVIPLMLGALVRLMSHHHGRYYILIPFVIAFLSDTGAYFTGCAFGKHKLAPIISPKKTVEGLFGGVAGAMLGMVLYCVILNTAFDFRVNYAYSLLYGLLGSLAAVFGDLCFSAIKRQSGIKDYGNLIPGHGGILDRFDSMTIVAPLVELMMALMPLAVRLW